MASMTKLTLALLLTASVGLSGCMTNTSSSSLGGDLFTAGSEHDDQARMAKLDRQLQHHARAVTSAWMAGDVPLAQEQFRIFTDLLPEEARFDDYFTNDNEREALDNIVASLLRDEEIPLSLDDRDGTPSRQWVAEQINKLLLKMPEAKEESVPDYFIDAVHREISLMVDNHRRSFAASLQRMDKELPRLRSIFADRDLPEEFFYVALVESSFNPSARSPAGPAGLWQFIPGTARKYGLEVNRKLDQRHDAAKATVAAGEYLSDIVKSELGQSFFLTLAAYNVGEGRVANNLEQIANADDKDFWGMWERKMIPSHTREYVAKITAAAIAGAHRSELGFPKPPARMASTEGEVSYRD